MQYYEKYPLLGRLVDLTDGNGYYNPFSSLKDLMRMDIEKPLSFMPSKCDIAYDLWYLESMKDLFSDEFLKEVSLLLELTGINNK